MWIVALVILTVGIWFWLVRLEWKADSTAWRLGTSLGRAVGSMLPLKRGGRPTPPTNRELSATPDGAASAAGQAEISPSSSSTTP